MMCMKFAHCAASGDIAGPACGSGVGAVEAAGRDAVVDFAMLVPFLCGFVSLFLE